MTTTDTPHTPDAHTAQPARFPRRARITPRQPADRAARGWLRELFSPPCSYLAPDEQVLISTRGHWLMPLRTLAQAAVAVPLAILLTFALATTTSSPWWLHAGLWLATLIHQGWLFYRILLWRTDRIVVTDKRLIRIHGFFTTTIDATHLHKITDTTYHRSFLGHVLNYGTLRIESAGQKQSLEHLKFIPHPDAIYRATLR